MWASSRTKPSSSTSIRVTGPVYRPASLVQLAFTIQFVVHFGSPSAGSLVTQTRL